MNLEEKVNAAIKTAMKEKNQSALRSLRAIKSTIMLAKTEKGADGQISETQELQILQKLVKQRRESFDIYEAQSRPDLAAKEAEEIVVIEEFLPAQMSDKEITSVVSKIIETTGASSIKDMGKVMGMSNKQMAGKADGKAIADIVKKLLS